MAIWDDVLSERDKAVFAAAGYGKKGGFGSRPAVVVIDVNYNFTGGPAPACIAACDADGDGSVSGQVTDALYLLSFSFLGGAPPPAPFPVCGSFARPSDEALGCIETVKDCGN